jgi:hypothetical protein
MILGAGDSLSVAQTDLAREAVILPALNLYHNLFCDCNRVSSSTIQACSTEQWISILEHTFLTFSTLALIQSVSFKSFNA